MHIRKFYIAILAIFVAIFLSGCASTSKKIPEQRLLGISDNEWNSYDKDKQQELMQAYQQVDAANQAEDAKDLAMDEQGIATGKIIKVKVYDGSALMPPFTAWQAFMPAVFTVREGTCANVDLTQLDGMEKTSLRSCYKNKLLRLDPSSYEADKQNGTASIPYSPLWDQGFAYHNISSDGYAKLKNVTVAVRIDTTKAN